MTIAKIRAALEKQLATIAPVLATAYENMLLNPALGVPYQRSNLLPNKPADGQISGNLYFERGIYQVTLCYPMGVGPGQAEARAQLVKDAFKRGTSLVEGAVTVIMTNAPSVSGAMIDGDRFCIPVSIYYQAQVGAIYVPPAVVVVVVPPVVVYNPATQFAPNLNGLWYDPSDYTTLSQDSAGTTPVTAVTQPVGRMLDKSGRNNTILQATATARPTQSARVNLLVKTENFADPSWVAFGATVSTPNFSIDPDGATTACRLQFTSATAQLYQIVTVPAGSTCANEWYVKSNTGANQSFRLKNSAPDVYSADLIATNVWQRFTYIAVAANSGSQSIGGNSTGIAADILVWHPSFAYAPSRYQRVDTASSYDVVGFPQFQTFDGIDDGMGTGAITLSADMDCFVAVRRATAANVVLAFNGTTNFFGVVASADVSAADTGSGTPTYVINGVSVNGGLTGTTRGQLHAAMPVASWVVLEIRNLNLTAGWAAFNIANYASFMFNGDFGGIILAPAGDATARQKNRQYLGAKVGLTLP